jgi:hypothetical protein
MTFWMRKYSKPLVVFWILVALGVAVGVSAAGSVTEEANLLANPGFELGEQGDFPVGWSGRGAGKDWVKLIEEEAYSGDRMVGLFTPHDRTSGWGIQTEPIPVTAGRTYEAAGMIKLLGARVQIYIEFYGSSGARIKPYVGQTRVNDEWTWLSISGEAPEGSAYARVLLYMPPNVPNTCAYFDDITFTEIVEEEVEEEDTRRSPGTFYVSSGGDNHNDGTLEAPWATVGYASARAIPGDTIVFLPGEYEGVLKPLRSGTADAPIVFRASERRTARLAGESGAAYAIELSNVEHISVEGFHVKPKSSQGGWLLVQGSKHIRINDVLMEDATGGMPFLITHSEHIQVRDSVIQRYIGGNMARVGDSAHILFEGNAISRTGHSPFQFYPERSTRNVVIRGNVFHAAWGRNFEFFGTENILFEHNIVTNAFDGGRSASTNAKFAVERGIFRFNRVFRNWGGALHLYTFREQWLSHIRLYNNVFDDNYEYGIATSDSPAQMRDVVFVNNVLSRNDVHGGHRQVQFQSMGMPEKGPEGELVPRVRFLSNALSASDPDFMSTLSFGGRRLDIGTVESDAWRQPSLSNQSVHFSGNVAFSPQFADAKTYNHALAPGSPLIDSGRFLTSTVGAGEGRTVRVEDAMYFYDGFGIEGEQGDLVVIGSPDQLARIVKVDYEANEITLDRIVNWQDGAPVSFPWGGQAPDMGVYEHGAGGRPSVQIVARPFFVRPQDEVRLSATLANIGDPVEIRWQLGDGTIAFGAELTHVYDEPYDYPIRVRVTTKSGEVFRGTGYVVVEPMRPVDDPLLHSTFDKEDEDWWWYWKCYTPAPVDWSHEIDGASGNGVLRISNPGGGTLPLRVAPAKWDIDQYPWIFLRYRVSPGAPIGLYLDGFSDTEGRGQRKWLAAASGERNTRTGRLTPYELIDDGNWHVLLMDARLIRADFPEVSVLKRLGMEALSVSRQGDAYWLDEIAILPDEALRNSAWEEKLTHRQRGHIDIVSPREGAVVSGEMVLDLALVAYGEVGEMPTDSFVQGITVDVDGQVVLSTADGREVEDLRIDTNALSDGPHQLAVTLTDEVGMTITCHAAFTVRNWQAMRDRLEPPEEWSFFGETMTTDLSKTTAESGGWAYASELEQSAFEGVSGKVKTTANEEYLIWEAPGLRNFEILVYTTMSDIGSVVRVEADTGDSEWVGLPCVTTRAGAIGSGDPSWTTFTITGNGPQGAEATAFRLIVGSEAPAYALGVEEVVLDIRSSCF